MIPLNLPKLTTDALRNTWDVHIEQWLYSIRARFERGDVTVELGWSPETLRLVESSINGVPTPYAQCARLIRSTTEGNQP